MSKFKMNEGLRDDVQAFANAGSRLNQSYETLSSDELQTLKASVKFIEEHKKIHDLLALYMQLIQKEEKDMKIMMQSAVQMDQNVGTSAK